MLRQGNAERDAVFHILEKGELLRGSVTQIPFGRLLYLIRRHLSLTQKMLSKRCKIPQPGISRIEKEAVKSNFATMCRLFDAMDVDLILLPILRKKGKKGGFKKQR